MLHQDYESKYLGEQIAGHESQEACRQDEQNDGKPPVVKYL
jgi:hypothetical protein